MASVIVSAPTDIAGLQAEMDRLLPRDVIFVQRRVANAGCADSNGKQVCSGARIAGMVRRSGQLTVASDPHGLRVIVPLHYDIQARPIGKGQGDTLSGDTAVSFVLGLTMDDKWTPQVRQDGGFTWPAAPKLDVLGGETSLAADVETALAPRLQRLPQGLGGNLVPAGLRQQVEVVWRHLNYPIEISQAPSLWLRGQPLGLHFAGIDVGLATPQLRIAIAAREQVFAGERPAPLPPFPLPALGSGKEPDGTGLVLPVAVSFAELQQWAGKALAAKPIKRSLDGPSTASAEVTGLDLFPAGKRLCVSVNLALRLPDAWQATHLVVHYLATPSVAPGGDRLAISAMELASPLEKPEALRQVQLGMLANPGLLAEIADLLAYDLTPRIAANGDLIKRISDLPLTKGLRLELRPGKARATDIASTADGLVVSFDTGGELFASPEPEVATSAGGPSAAP